MAPTADYSTESEEQILQCATCSHILERTDCQEVTLLLSATIRDARLNLSKLLKLAQQGHEIIICNRDTPVAKLVPYREEERKPFPDLSKLRDSLRATGKSSLSAEDLVRDDREGR